MVLLVQVESPCLGGYMNLVGTGTVASDVPAADVLAVDAAARTAATACPDVVEGNTFALACPAEEHEGMTGLAVACPAECSEEEAPCLLALLVAGSGP